MTVIFDDSADCLVEVQVRLPLAEVRRLTRIVEKTADADPVSFGTPGRIGDTPENLAAYARLILQARRKRDTFFAGIEFGEPAWDMLLDLYVAHCEGANVSISSLAAASAVPQTTAMRWIETMVAKGHFTRCPDRVDGRRTNVILHPRLIDTIERYLTDMRRRAVATLS